ncbi:MAG: hypothetical protein QM657_15000 [Lacrimispora sp.]|uniref:hypothetical protein n=1 Tax=Lacrimispora sp. TaxID=2719234 RepID=UPI0039E4D0ED
MGDKNIRQKKNTPMIRAVMPLDHHRLHIEFGSGNVLELNMENRLRTTRYYDLNSDEVFRSASTDGVKIMFHTGTNLELEIFPREAVRLAMKSPGEVMGILQTKLLESGRIWLEMKSGSILALNLNGWLGTNRYSPLKKPEVLQSISTDGEHLIFSDVLKIEEEELVRLTLMVPPPVEESAV